MPWTIVWSRRALKEAARLDRRVRERILAALEKYAETEYGDVKRLQGLDPPVWRLRVGGYRVMLAFDHLSRTVQLQSVRSRGRAYRD